MSRENPFGFSYCCRRRSCAYSTGSITRSYIHDLITHGGIRDLWTGEVMTRFWNDSPDNKEHVLWWLWMLFWFTLMLGLDLFRAIR